MKTGTRLALYGLGLVVAFGGAYAIAGAVVPESVVTAWTTGADTDAHTDTPHATDSPSAPDAPSAPAHPSTPDPTSRTHR
ncbi:hypothetical protein [Plantibacter sp. YIM 135347]|uniref:hypothetical protein n=1 Tax=Plantibacter sp. YIM 135347 TaxID=3423919 RepID=UPI003D34BCBF